jgi:hypothetical protein
MRGLILAVIVGLAAGAAQAAPQIASGAYDNTLLVGVDPTTGVVTGYFDMNQGDTEPSFSCIFYFKGRLVGGSANIESYFPDDPKGDLIHGVLTAKGPAQVRLTLQTEHGGCGQVFHFADADQPADFVLPSAKPWTSVRVVQAAKAYFYPAPGAAHGRAYLVKGDGVGDKRTSSGWLRETDLYAP